MRLPGKLGRETRILWAGESAPLEEGSLRVGNLRLDEAVAHRARHLLVERGAQACQILRRENRLDRQSRIRLEARGLERRVHRIAQAFLLPNALPQARGRRAAENEVRDVERGKVRASVVYRQRERAGEHRIRLVGRDLPDLD